eukprot:CAMPEP_0172669218 /NCGR_PEP_ID=MMETSP1074-20121228/9540_1 /TAXON_ID=2916 /ORGANISM="Ceratium fusus, Strain PA161109" /LENGTH=69 /DNA_ID=CAMNT_0013485965 /DNA_START=890 /DNA_END=1099 /DNA_ORIENTATION=-
MTAAIAMPTQRAQGVCFGGIGVSHTRPASEVDRAATVYDCMLLLMARPAQMHTAVAQGKGSGNCRSPNT